MHMRCLVLCFVLSYRYLARPPTCRCCLLCDWIIGEVAAVQFVILIMNSQFSSITVFRVADEQRFACDAIFFLLTWFKADGIVTQCRQMTSNLVSIFQ